MGISPRHSHYAVFYFYICFIKLTGWTGTKRPYTPSSSLELSPLVSLCFIEKLPSREMVMEIGI